MSLIAVGLSHRTAPVPVLERAALPAEVVPEVLREALGGVHVAEAAVLATCNRLEVYAEVDKFHGGVAELGALLQARTGMSLEELTPHLYVHYEERAVSHLFGVAAGLDSMVVGEGQILGQVKQALRTAQEVGTARRVLNELLQTALRVGKRARSETGIDRAGQSVVGVGLASAEGVLDGLAGRRALVVGAGSLSALAATTLARAGVAEVVIANRTPEHGARVAAAVGGRHVPLDALPAELALADVVVSCTGAVGTVVRTDVVAAALQHRAVERGGTTPYAVVDLALPRDVDPGVAELPGVHLVDLERIGELVAAQEGGPDVAAARAIVTAEVQAFAAWQAAAAVAPTVVALRARADQVVTAELERLDGRLPALDPRARDEVAQTVRRVVDKLLHTPTVRAKELAGEPLPVSYAEVLRELFDLGPGPGEEAGSGLGSSGGLGSGGSVTLRSDGLAS
ncbi:glutamyl-tRNA reductase [Motilibacter rhizosphaerae]|uniref:Glutamyl-tRNA reductase n=1 Tax=Motilibacter rhizosphaerae TaxID=598652 RepID=A0A4Q7NAA4_9ACTN|nr:glutamyl-tRNA reductase [Motilibacter rhizosphaerae]RZS79060.1 glutamyl-tRNA reductase [Motilibacter rhizosphaerae]